MNTEQPQESSRTPNAGDFGRRGDPGESVGSGELQHVRRPRVHAASDEAEPVESLKRPEAPTQWCGFTLIRKEPIADTEGEGLLYRHDILGTEIFIIQNQDPLRSCRIALHTPPTDSTGKEHVFEHDSFRGDAHFSSQDPVWEYQRGSANSDSNAETDADRTTYYFSSPRPADFANLLDLSLSAVFFSRNARETFLQEAWRIEVDPDDPQKTRLRFNGIVLNEMKGACTGVHHFHDIVVPKNLFPDCHLSNYSGGMPPDILRLTHEQLLAFREATYHPSNSRIVFSGDIDIKETLEAVAAKLTDFSPRGFSPPPVVGPTWENTKRVDCTYPGAETENRAQDTLMSLSWELGTRLDPLRNTALEILSTLLVDEDIGLITEILSDSGLGNEPSSDGVWEASSSNCLTIGLAGASYLEAPQFEELIVSSIGSIISAGFSKEAIEIAFKKYRLELLDERNGPDRGASWSEAALSAWMYGGDPFEALRVNEQLDILEKAAGSEERIFEKLIEELLSRPRLLVTLRPDRSLLDDWAKEEEALLRERVAALGTEGLAQVLEESASLPERLARFDTVRARAAVPRLNVTHLRKRIEPSTALQSLEDARVSTLDLSTNGITYLNLALDLSGISEVNLPYAGVLARCMFETGTTDLTPAAFKRRIVSSISPVESAFHFRPHFATSQLSGKLVLSTHCFTEDLPLAADILRAGILEARLYDRAQVTALMREEIEQLEASLHAAESEFSTTRAGALVSAQGNADDSTSGIQYLRRLREIEREARRGNWRAIRSALEETRALILRASGLRAHATGDQASLPSVSSALSSLLSDLGAAGIDSSPLSALWSPVLEGRNEAIVIPSQVNYLARAIPLDSTGWNYHASSDVVCNHLHHTTIWDRVRRQGGAYGGYVDIYSANRMLVLSSHSDPNISRTLEVFSRVPDYIRSLAEDLGGIRQSIVRSVCQSEAPEHASMRGLLSFYNHMAGVPTELKQQRREERMATGPEHYFAFAEVVRQALSGASFVVLGSRKEIEEAEAQGLSVRSSVL